MDLEVRGGINVVEACAQTESVEKIVFSSSLCSAIWRENICSDKDVDERSWSDQEFCWKLKVSLYPYLFRVVCLYSFYNTHIFKH